MEGSVNMKRKMKRFAEGEVIDMRDNPNNTVGDDARARAMKFIETGKKEEAETAKPTPRRAPAPVRTTPIVKSKVEEKSKAEDNTETETAPPVTKNETKDYSDQSSRKVTNEEAYKSLPFTDRLKMEAKSAIRNTSAQDVANTALSLFPATRALRMAKAFRGAKDITSRTEQLAAPPKQVGYDKSAAKSERTRASGAMEKDFKPSEIREGFKKGGMARSSASKRADGIATKGFTRACGGGMMKGKK